MKWKAIAVVSLSLLLFFLFIAVVYFGVVGAGFGLRRFDSAAVVTQIQQLKQLVTVRYSIQRVVGLTEQKQPFGEESLLLMVQGEALAGVDLSVIKAGDATYQGHVVTIYLPPARVFNVFIDEKQTKVWDHHITWWTPWVPYDPDLEHRARLSALDDIRSAALKMGILDTAQQNAQSAIRDFLRALHVEARFKTKGLD
ncbi:MAG: DUF4230 domain-containing protein [Bryobacteraceae bacterium]